MVRAFDPFDLNRIRTLAPIPDPMRAGVLALPDAGPCWTAHRDGIVHACAGLVLFWPGRAGTWCVIGADFPTSAWPWLTKRVRRGLAEAARELRLRRIEAEALTGWDPAAHWLALLGFRPEGTMAGYGHDGTDYDRWARVNQEATHGA